MKVAILGFGLQGESALEYWGSPDNQITICDKNIDLELPGGVASQLGENYLNDLNEFDLIVRSPSIHPKEIFQKNPNLDGKKITSVTNEFFTICPTSNIIGVTGTKGKGTTSTLITKMLEADGNRVHLGGNIGTPPLEMLKNDIQPDDWVVLELANFQLIDLRYSPRIAVCLMVVPEHQDWHADFDEYLTAKQQLFRWQKPEDTAIYFASNKDSTKVVDISPGHKIPYFEPPGAKIVRDNVEIGGQQIAHTSTIKLLGKHNWQNICAAITAVWQITKNIEPIRSVITSFSGIEYRLELIRELKGVKYYNDSFGTTPETAIVALEAIPGPKIIVLGGSDKGADFTNFASAIKKNNVKYAIIIGVTAQKIEKALKDNRVSTPYSILDNTTMDEIVNLAQEKASAGDTVLLSTGCASFGLFKDYKDRGDQFNRAVLSLK